MDELDLKVRAYSGIYIRCNFEKWEEMMRKIIFSLLTIFFAYSLFSQNFLPPDNIQVDECGCILSWEPPTLMQITDSLDNYNVGDYLALESPNWTTWSNAPGSEEDALITD